MSAPESTFTVRVRRGLVPDLFRMHEAASGRHPQFAFESYLGQLLEIAVVSFRQLKYPPRLDSFPRGRAVEVSGDRKVLKASEVEQLIGMYEEGTYSQEKLASRFHCSATTISRIIRKHRAQEEAE